MPIGEREEPTFDAEGDAGAVGRGVVAGDVEGGAEVVAVQVRRTQRERATVGRLVLGGLDPLEQVTGAVVGAEERIRCGCPVQGQVDQPGEAVDRGSRRGQERFCLRRCPQAHNLPHGEGPLPAQRLIARLPPEAGVTSGQVLRGGQPFSPVPGVDVVAGGRGENGGHRRGARQRHVPVGGDHRPVRELAEVGIGRIQGHWKHCLLRETA
ncbi:MAG TPA: hypothetical protein DGT23_06115 [Micromonosporaceae bacterium]|nr:hypothetical protein [Micromonosporaceae bacterium]